MRGLSLTNKNILFKMTAVFIAAAVILIGGYNVANASLNETPFGAWETDLSQFFTSATFNANTKLYIRDNLLFVQLNGTTARNFGLQNSIPADSVITIQRVTTDLNGRFRFRYNNQRNFCLDPDFLDCSFATIVAGDFDEYTLYNDQQINSFEFSNLDVFRENGITITVNGTNILDFIDYDIPQMGTVIEIAEFPDQLPFSQGEILIIFFITLFLIIWLTKIFLEMIVGVKISRIVPNKYHEHVRKDGKREMYD